MHVLYQVVTATATATSTTPPTGSSDGTDWGSIAGWVAAGIAFLALIFTNWNSLAQRRTSSRQLETSQAALRTSQDQLTQAQSTLNDRRLDERVKAILGENILLINNLTEQARTTLQDARASAKEVESIRATVEQTNKDVQAQGKDAAQSRAELQESLNEGRQLLRELKDAAQTATNDAAVISRAREIAQSEEEMARETIDTFRAHGYLVTSLGGTRGEHGMDLIAIGRFSSGLLINILVVLKALGAEVASQSSLSTIGMKRDYSERRLFDSYRHHGVFFREDGMAFPGGDDIQAPSAHFQIYNVVVTNRPLGPTEKDGDTEFLENTSASSKSRVSIVAISELPAFLSALPID